MQPQNPNPDEQQPAPQPPPAPEADPLLNQPIYPTPTNVQSKKLNYLLVGGIGVAILLIAAIGIGVYVAFVKNDKTAPVQQASSGPVEDTSYQKAVDKYITAVRDKDRATAVALESPGLKALAKQEDNSDSAYDSCIKAGPLCTGYFSGTFLSDTTKKVEDYSSKSGIKGKKITYTRKQSASQNGVDVSVTNYLQLDVIPNGSNAWLIDNWDVQ